jgi:prepilin-type processing-associated H-X9-DG protein
VEEGKPKMTNIHDIRRTIDERGHRERVNYQSLVAFTLIELLVVIANLAILAAILLPVLRATQGGAPTILCMNNHKRLITAWLMYSRDNQDVLCPNPALNIAQSDETIGTSWVAGYEHLDANLQDNTNVSYLQNSLLAPYCNRTVSIYKCPDDAWLCTEGGVLMPRVRSVSMNTCIEGNYYIVTGGNAALGIPNNEAYYPATENLRYYCYVKLTDIGPTPGPSPANMWVTGDEHGNTINNGNMSWFGNGTTWGDTPASYHDFGNNYSFADGHVGYHNWMTKWTATGGTSGTGLAGWPQLSQYPPGGLTGPALGNKVDYQWVTADGTALHP